MDVYKSNNKLLIDSFNNKPVLVIDCANMMNPHSFYPALEFEDFASIMVLEAELLYYFQQIIDSLELYINNYGIKTVAIPMKRLFNYDNDEENKKIYSKIIKKLNSLNVKVMVHWSLLDEVYKKQELAINNGPYSNKSKKDY